MKKNFYRAFEEKYRGSRELIIGRLQFYRPFLDLLVREYGCVPAIDLGCGRGEWLEVLTAAGLEAHGVDLDDGMLQACVDSGLPAEKGDAIEKLKSLPAESQAIVSAFHVVEHIPFDSLQQLVTEAKRVLLPGGLLILETPNPENIKVATCNFYLDPTHHKPIPPDLLSFVAEYAGYERIKIIRLQESQELLNKSNLQLTDVLAGVSPDYSVVAQKTADQSILMAFDEMFSQEYGLTIQKLSSDYDGQIVKGIAEKTMNDLLQNELASAKTRIETLSAEAALARGLSDSLNKEIATKDKEIATKDEEIFSLRDELAKSKDLYSQVESELAKQNHELQGIHQANHQHWLLVQNLEEQLLSIRSSVCWRVTAPVRRCHDTLRAQQQAVKAYIKDGMLKRAAKYIRKKPKLKGKVLKVLSWFPKLQKITETIISDIRISDCSLIEIDQDSILSLKERVKIIRHRLVRFELENEYIYNKGGFIGVQQKLKKRIGVDLTPMRKGGINGGLKPLIINSIKKMHELIIENASFVFFTNSESHDEVREFAGKDDEIVCILTIEDHTVQISNTTNALESIGEYSNPLLMYENNVDVLYCPFGATNLKGKGIPVVSCIVDLLHKDYPLSISETEIIHREKYLSQTIANSDAINCISQHVMQRVKDVYPQYQGKLFYTYNTIHERFNTISSEKVEEIGENPFFFYPANYWLHKNHEVLFIAYNMYLKKQNSDAWSLVLTGHEDERCKSLKALAETLGIEKNVLFMGHLSENKIKYVWERASALVFPSLHEGFGIPLIEAMHFGKPIVASNICSIPEIVGDSADLVDPRSPDEIASALYKVSSDHKYRLKASEKTASEIKKFSFNSETEKLANVLLNTTIGIR